MANTSKMLNRTFARNPASMLTQDNVRQALLEYIVNPFMSHKVLAFRIAWTTKTLPEDTIWQHIFTQSRNAFEDDVKAYGGIAFFITAATATVSNQTKRRDVCPALGYFVVAETPEFKEAPMYIRLRNNPYGGILKLMNDRGVKPGDNRNLVWLSLLLKDNVDSGYVLGKMAAAGLHSNSVVRMFVHTKSYREPLLRAKGILESLGFSIEFEYF